MARRPRLGILVAAVFLLAAVACGSDSSDTSSDTTNTTGTTAGPGDPGFNEPTDPFYQAPDPLPPGEPGDIIRSEPLPGAPAGAQGYKVLYRSTGINGEPIAVSGVIIVPEGAPPDGGRPVYAWAHGTTGVVDACAPSSSPTFYEDLAGLADVLAAGYVVAATDYEGLGTRGVHPYLVGESEARGVLDIARAASKLEGSGASNKVLVNGHSQGGQASLFVGQIHRDYAKDLDVLGIAAMAPAAELASLVEAQSSNLIGVVIGTFALNAYYAVYSPTTPGMSLDQVLTPEALDALPKIVGTCVDAASAGDLLALATPLEGKLINGNPAQTPPWSDLLQRNTPGSVGIDAPLFVAQGSDDVVVPPATTEQYVRNECANGGSVQFKVYDGASHFSVPQAALPDILTWMKGLVDGQPAPTDCGSLPAS